ncbi:aldo/keto reductase [Anaeromyxobacter paludicola]|uniref:Aldo/keto reductase n=1 Tax=Anaeromyxobacter paludicola TaxID=2918171 RepID=A0ABM7XFP9_9BACT|nr:aldo/keto reductase [Anaeromyxobacter paludicola]BDG10706.1 aldo/keto reductase [Anaeromyxobacter paludicola]
MPLDHYVSLGRSGLRVSPLCLGAMTFGEDWGWGASVADSEAMIDRFLARGGNFIDTANIYTKGHSEKIIGDHLGRHPAKRDRVVIATKFFSNLYSGDPNGGGASRKAIVSACEQSLRRLQTGYVDLYWMHSWDASTPIDETLRALDDLVREGKVRYVGFSDTPAWKCAEAQVLARFLGQAPVTAIQVEYSLLERTIEGELVPMAREHGMGITPWSPLKSGVLTGKYRREEHGRHQAGRGEWATRALDERAYAVIDLLGELARELGTTVSRVALAWVMGRPGVSSTILGARTVAQLEDNLGAADVTLTPAQAGRLEALTVPKLDFPHDFVANNASFFQGGTTIDGRPAAPWPLAPKGDDDRW